MRVKDLAPEPLWRSRYDSINDFERMLVRDAPIALPHGADFRQHPCGNMLTHRLMWVGVDTALQGCGINRGRCWCPEMGPDTAPCRCLMSNRATHCGGFT